MPVISIIVPVYNAEKYMRRCIDSILAQTFRDFECILVDDGSTDGSPRIADEYAAQDSRIVVLHTVNGGTSAARNAGLDRAKGQWIGFADNDDWCDRGMFQFLYENAIKEDVDVSVCEFKQVVEETGEIVENKTIYKNNRGQEKLYDNGDEAISAVFSWQAIHTTVWNKLIKAECIRRLQLRFDTAVRYVEDMVFVYQLLKSNVRVFYSPQSYYYFLRRRSSLSHQSFLQKYSCLAVYDHLIRDMQNKKVRKKMILYKTEVTSGACYLEAENYRDERCTVFFHDARKHFMSFFRLPLPFKARLSRMFCVLSPAAFLFLRRIYRAIRRTGGGG